MTVIDPYSPRTEYYTEERCFITELRKTVDDPGCSIARARVEPGVTTRFHILKGTIERYVILEGIGLVEVGDNPPCRCSLHGYCDHSRGNTAANHEYRRGGSDLSVCLHPRF